MSHNKLIIPILMFLLLGCQTSDTQKKSDLKILFIGDSITDGNWGRGDGKPASERNHWDMNHFYGSGYMYLCTAHYLAKYPGLNFTFVNRGMSGHKLDDLEKRWKKDALDINPDIISILIGTNDVDFFLHEKAEGKTEDFDFNGWEKQYRSLLEQSRAKNPELKIVLCAPFVEKSGTRGENENWPLRDRLVRQCGKVVKHIANDFNAVFLPYQQMFDETIAHSPQPITYWIWDGVHPTVAGHRLMADLWIEKVKLPYLP